LKKAKAEARGKRDNDVCPCHSYLSTSYHRKRKATQPIKIKAKTHANEYGRYNNSVLNNL